MTPNNVSQADRARSPWVLLANLSIDRFAEQVGVAVVAVVARVLLDHVGEGRNGAR